MEKTTIRIPERFKDHPIFNEKICGTNFGFMSKRGYYLRDDIKKQPELMREAGINWTTLNMNFCQERYYDQKHFLDFEFSSGEYELSETVRRLHDNGIRVLFKPCLTCLDGVQMGRISFPSPGTSSQIEGVYADYWGKWFRSFTEVIKYFADFSEQVGMDALILGAEYAGTEEQNDHWMKVIEAARQNYSNPLTYETTRGILNRYHTDWLKELDFLSISYYPGACEPKSQYSNGNMDSSYNPFAKENPSKNADEMVDYLVNVSKAQDVIRDFSRKFNNMPVAMTECGTRSAHGCIMQPFNFKWDTYYDGQEQADYMEACFRTFWDMPEWMGLFWWKWDETQDRPQYKGDPNGDKGFTVQGKPAEAVMRKWCEMAKR